MSWVNARGKPQIAVATFFVPTDSPNIVESKSFKLYLGSFAQTAFESVDAVRDTLKRDASVACGAVVSVQLASPSAFAKLKLEELDDQSLDRLDLDTDIYHPDPSLLSASHDESPVEETLVSDLLSRTARSPASPTGAACRFTTYVGAPIDQAGLLRYLISFRNHTGFHEQCVERIFVDILRECRPVKLAVYARYTRRGGLDINPFRTNFNQPMPDNARTARQ
ncbi:MAG: NADPH-dependent 7-cyano-7-deazaguanine reductase [Burkholderia gladioli]|nr:MAG: NADPH-dependent 7-cyano-7-deazaguanine reductase [Burkholderia gladioli]